MHTRDKLSVQKLPPPLIWCLDTSNLFTSLSFIQCLLNFYSSFTFISSNCGQCCIHLLTSPLHHGTSSTVSWYHNLYSHLGCCQVCLYNNPLLEQCVTHMVHVSYMVHSDCRLPSQHHWKYHAQVDPSRPTTHYQPHHFKTQQKKSY